jgi:hypothetical protein
VNGYGKETRTQAEGSREARRWKSWREGSRTQKGREKIDLKRSEKGRRRNSSPFFFFCI